MLKHFKRNWYIWAIFGFAGLAVVLWQLPSSGPSGLSEPSLFEAVYERLYSGQSTPGDWMLVALVGLIIYAIIRD